MRSAEKNKNQPRLLDSADRVTHIGRLLGVRFAKESCMLSRASKVTGVGLAALVSGVLAVPACSSGGDDDGARSTAGSGGSSAGSTSGGTSAGSINGGTGGSMAGSGGVTTYACEGVVPPSTAITDFTDLMPASAPLWGAPAEVGAFYGGLFSYGGPDAIPVTDVSEGNLHVTGTVKDYSGAGLYVAYCTDASKFEGVRFTISGDVGPTKQLLFSLQTNTNLYPDPMAMKGVCEASAEKKFIDCVPPNVAVTDISDQAKVVEVTWDQLKAGLPAAAATTDGSDVVGFQWSFRWTPGMATYAVDLTIDDVEFIGAGSAAGGAGAGGAGSDPGMAGAGGAP
jgi:hypothetical protein